MYRFQIRKFVIVRVYAHAKEQARISAVYDLVVAEFDEIGLVLLVARGYEAVDLAFEAEFGFVLAMGVRRRWLRKRCGEVRK